MKMTKVLSKISLVKSSKNNSIFLSAFYLIICLMKAPKNFEKFSLLRELQISPRPIAPSNFSPLCLMLVELIAFGHV